MQLKQVSSGQRILQLRKYSLPSTNLQEQSYTLYIPGQPSDTAVYKYHDRSMICHKCHKYGHTKHDADEKQFAEIVEKKTTQVAKQINAQMNLRV